MNDYLIRIIDVLCKKDGFVNKKDLMDDLNINKSKFYYYINELNSIIHDNNMSEIYDDGVSLKVNKLQLIQMKQLSLKDKYYFNLSERKDFIVLILALSIKTVNYRSLELFLNVSRNTIVNDLNELKKTIEIEYDKDKGLYLVGKELDIRYYVLQSLFRNNNRVIWEKKKDLIRKIVEQIGLDKSLLHKVEQIVHQEKDQYLSIENLSVAILAMYIRSLKNNIEVLDFDYEEEDIRTITERLSNLKIEYMPNEKKYLYLLIQSARVIPSTKQIKNQIILDFINDFVDGFNRIYYINLKEYNIYHMLKSHLYSLYYRSKYKILLFDYSDIKINIVDNYGFNYLVNSIEHKYNLEIESEERLVLMCYFESIRIKDNCYINDKKIVIVCGAGLGSSSYIKYQLIRMFDNSFQIDIVDYEHLEDRVDDDTVLVISTLNIDIPQYVKSKQVDWINVPIVFKETDKKVLIDWLINNSNSESSNDIKNIINIIANNATIEDKNNLYFQLNKYLSNSQKNQSNELHLLDLIELKHINIFNEKCSLFQGLDLTGESLVEDEIINNQYIEDIKKTIKEYGLYCECFNGIIIPHARPHHNVKRPAISIGIFKNPIYVQQYNKEVSAIFVLAVTDKESHIEAFSELIEFLKDKNRYKNICSYKSSEELYFELKKFGGK